MNDGSRYHIRVAMDSDAAAIDQLIRLSAVGLNDGLYTDQQLQAALGSVMGVDSQLIVDGTYFVAQSPASDELAACGGWSFRATLFGADDLPDRDSHRLDPKEDAARIRAFFIHPDHARQGLGRILHDHCVAEAKKHGFTRMALGSTLPGVPFYRAMGYQSEPAEEYPISGGLTMTLVPMSKQLG